MHQQESGQTNYVLFIFRNASHDTSTGILPLKIQVDLCALHKNCPGVQTSKKKHIAKQ